jgi:hypothetical protein
MNTFTFDGSWNRIKGKLKQKYALLTDDDLLFVEGSRSRRCCRRSPWVSSRAFSSGASAT